MTTMAKSRPTPARELGQITGEGGCGRWHVIEIYAPRRVRSYDIPNEIEHGGQTFRLAHIHPKSGLATYRRKAWDSPGEIGERPRG